MKHMFSLALVLFMSVGAPMAITFVPATASAQQEQFRGPRGTTAAPFQEMTKKADQAVSGMRAIAYLLAFAMIIFVGFSFWRGDPAAWSKLGMYAAGIVVVFGASQILEWLVG